MNATPHTTLGYTSLKLIGVNPIGCVVAVATHFIFDYVGEKGIVSTKDRVIYDLLPTVIAGIFLYFYSGVDEAWLLVYGSLLGNLPDLIDKKLYLTIFFPSKFKSTNYLHWQKPIINPKELQTKIIGYVAMILIILINLVK
jgi:hypothetical protein